eukprot:TRINITY_DN1920_c0_g1_i1.p2 TRINITY_DN1920_c0_g1~~TRINITY_DN1920_c0_g1_i1.p2  ORF type:complete len:56 (-),score=8.11 TRINITY_DN1920_c0_g1_i1:374-541(-)
MAMTKITAVTFWKQCIHLRLSDRWPPTSTSLNFTPSIVHSVSEIPVVLTRHLNKS